MYVTRISNETKNFQFHNHPECHMYVTKRG